MSERFQVDKKLSRLVLIVAVEAVRVDVVESGGTATVGAAAICEAMDAAPMAPDSCAASEDGAYVVGAVLVTAVGATNDGTLIGAVGVCDVVDGCGDKYVGGVDVTVGVANGLVITGTG
jgi:hypothetical protein